MKNLRKSTCQDATKNRKEFIDKPSTFNKSKKIMNRQSASKSDKNKKDVFNRPSPESDENNNKIVHI